jgi:hypothetical protein
MEVEQLLPMVPLQDPVSNIDLKSILRNETSPRLMKTVSWSQKVANVREYERDVVSPQAQHSNRNELMQKKEASSERMEKMKAKV